MFRPKRAEVPADEVAREFVMRTARSADRSFTEFCDSVLQILLRNRLPHEGAAAIYANKDLKRLYFVGLLAVGLAELEQTKDRRTLPAVVRELLVLLRFGCGPAGSAGDMVLDCLRRVEAAGDEMRPQDAVALHLLRHIGLAESERLERVLRNPLCVTPLTSLLAAAASGAWTALEGNVAMAA